MKEGDARNGRDIADDEATALESGQKGGKNGVKVRTHRHRDSRERKSRTKFG
jgi:hypothetical protein